MLSLVTGWTFSPSPRSAIGSRLARRATVCGLMALALLASAPVQAFSPIGTGNIVYSGPGVVDVEATFEQAARWGAESLGGVGLHDGIQVAVEPGFAEKFGVTDPAEIALLERAVVAAFEAWESPVLSFDVFFDAATEQGAGLFEIDLFAVNGEVGPGAPFGWCEGGSRFVANRLLTNGQRYDGRVMTYADLFFNLDNIAWFQSQIQLTDEEKLAALQRLVMHEVGHALGLGHPTVDPYNFDSDLDPMSVVVVDPSDPFGALMVSPNVDDDAIMSGLNYGSSLDALFFKELRPDDRSGLNVLYPVPEPATPSPTPTPSMPTTTPTVTPTPTPTAPAIQGEIQTKVHLEFHKSSKDKIRVKVKNWQLPAGVVPGEVTVNVGGAELTGTLDPKGRFTSPDKCNAMMMKQSSKTQLWKLTVKRKNNDFAADLADEGLTNADHPKPGLPVSVPLSIEVGGTTYREDVNLVYRSKLGKKGIAK